MHRILAVVALCATSFAVPILPTQAAPLLTDDQANCLIFPMLKKECWQMGADMVSAPVTAVAMAAGDAADAAGEVKLPFMWWNCTAAEAGSGHLLDC
ncbi:hypothetical protein [Devosia sp.]|uniref:hypothetical protein n=1 Tax=Devosia sp. TaxID=1871048 RepID=UPI0035B42A17